MSEKRQLAMHESRNRATSAAVMCHIVSFGQKYTERPIGSRSSRSTSEHLHTIFVNSAREKTSKLKTPLAPAILAREGYFVVV